MSGARLSLRCVLPIVLLSQVEAGVAQSISPITVHTDPQAHPTKVPNQCTNPPIHINIHNQDCPTLSLQYPHTALIQSLHMNLHTPIHAHCNNICSDTDNILHNPIHPIHRHNIPPIPTLPTLLNHPNPNKLPIPLHLHPQHPETISSPLYYQWIYCGRGGGGELGEGMGTGHGYGIG